MIRIRLGDACEKIGSGATPRGGSEVYQSSGLSLIRSQNVHNDGFKKNGLVFLSPEHGEELSHVTVLHSDVLLNITGDSVARVCQVIEDVLPARVNQHVAIIRPKKNIIDPRYLRYFLVSSTMQQYMLALAAAGATRNALTKGMIEDLEVPAPPLSAQKAIAHILGTLDDKIELNRRMNETLEAMARAIFKSWFVDFDQVRAKAEGRQPEGKDADTAALFPDSFEDSTLGQIPRGWKISSFDQLVEIWSGGTPKTSFDAYWNGDIPWFTVTDAPSESDIFVIDTGKYITQAGVDNSATRLLLVGTTIISARGTVGKLAMVGRPMAMNQTCYGLKGKKGYPDPFIYFQTKALVEELKQRTHGCVFDTIIRDTFKMLEVASPPANVAEAFGAKVEPILQKIYGNLLESRTLAAIRDALLPKLMSGEIRIKDAEKFMEEQ